MGHSAFSRRNIVELLIERAEAHPDRVALRFLGEGDAISETFTYGELHRRVATLAAHLQERTSPGDRALLLYPGGSAYVLSILACFYAGVIAVPAYPPETTHPRHLGRLLSIVQGARPKLMLTSAALLPSLLAAEQAIEELRGASILGTDALAEDADDLWRSPRLGDDAIAFLQYTSGSTSRPKGVIVGHANLMANEAAIRRAFGMTDDDVVLSWLPLFHDMGLIGGLLQPLYSGISGILLTPQQFIERPSRWLRAIDTLGATVSGGPDFAYRMCAERITEAQAQAIDLRRWRVAFCGAEPIRARSMRAFAERFAPSGFDAGALYPCYGLAEATLLVTGGVRGGGARVLEVDRDALAGGHGVAQADGQALVDCGVVQPEHRLVIVDRETGDTVPDGRVGEIHVAGPSIARGYFENDEATRASFVRFGGETYLRTGDLGFVQKGGLFVTGRESDKIIVCGQNLYPQDIERTIEEEVEVVRKGRVVAFAVAGPDGEGIGVAAEISPRMQKLVRPDAVCVEIAEAVARVHGHPVIAFALLSPGGITLTSSGKLQRSLCRKRWEAQSFEHAFHLAGAGAANGSSDRDTSEGSLTATESKLADLWKDVLAIASVRRDDSFFALGGSSLRAAQVRAAIEKAFGVLVPLRAAFEHPTLGALATLLDSSAPGSASIAPIPALPLDADCGGLSDGEARLYFLQKLDPANKAYDLCERFRVRGAIDEARLRACFDVLVLRHESLRTTFREDEDGRVRRAVAPSGHVDLAITDLTDRPERARPEEARSIAEREAKRVFDLERGPLFRAHLVRLGAEEHELVLVVHHIVADAWSLRLLMRELGALYDAAGSPSALGELSIRYADYAAWQRSRPDSELESSLAYYRTLLGAGREQPVLELPHDRPRPATHSYRGAKHAFTLDATLTQSLRQLGQAHAATPFMVLLAGFQVVLHRYSRQREVRVGVPFANRSRPEVEGLFGFFVNTQVLAASLSGDATVTSVLANAREAALSAQDHEALPFERLMTDLAPARSLGHNPLFQALFNHLSADFTSSAGGRFERIERVVSGTQFDLSLDTIETGDRIEAEIVYSTDLFDAETIARLARSYVLVLEAMAKSSPSSPIGALPLLEAESVREIVETWNDTAKPYALSRPVHLLIEEAAAASPEAIAVRFEGASLTYAELDARAGMLARQLVGDGVGPDDLVGVCAERSIELVIALLAVLKADGAYLPLEPTYPSARLAHEIAHAKPRVVLTQERFREVLPREAPVRLLDDVLQGEIIAAFDRPPAELPKRASVDHLAYCIFTSGSTGKPKAVLCTHRGLVNRLTWMQDAYRLMESERDRVLQKTPFTFDVSVWEFFWPLMTGATLVVAPAGAHKDTAQLGALLRDEKITTAHFVPSMLSAFASAGELASCGDLRQVFSSGEALSADLAATFTKAHRARLHNLYGPTEAAIDVTSWECQRGDVRTPPIGKPIANVALHVLDDRLQPVPVGVAGDLHIAGICLARGYLGAPDLTADRFVPSPFDDGARMYRTGDVARYRRDGAIEYLGRSDHQVKVRGHRIELGEIESRLREHASLADAAVVARADGASEKRLVAYVVPTAKAAIADGAAPETLRDELRAHLESALPDFMVPQLWVFLPSLPLSHNGKLDRAALPAPDPNQLRKAYVAPSTDAERALAQIWSDALHVAEVGADDNFFELGGDSIVALQVVGRAKRAGLALAVKNVFSHQTLRALASIARPIDSASTDDAITDFALTQEEAAAVATRDDVEDAFPLSPMQEGLLLHTLLEPGSGIYLMQDAYRLTTALDVDAFLRAWEGVVARHAALRASFAWKHEGRMLQIIHRTVPSPAEYLDLRALGEAEQRAHIEHVLREERESGMDMQRAPLMRVRLVQHGEDAFSFVQSYHHILIDDWCRSLMLVDFFTLYRAYAAKGDVKLAPTRPYRDFIAWLGRQDQDKARTYWRTALEGFESATKLSIGVPCGTSKSSNSRIATQAILLGHDESEILRATAKRERLTVNTIAQGAWAWVLSQLGGTDDVLFGVTVAGRPAELEGIQDTVGLFINTVPLRVRVPESGAPIASWLGSLFTQNVELREFEHLPLTDVQSVSEIARGEPLFHSLFVFENAPLDRSVHELSADMDAGFSGNRTHTNYPITVVIVPGDRYRLQISFDERWFGARDIERVLAMFHRAVLFMAERPSAKTSEVPRFDSAEREQMRAWNRTERAYPFERGYFQLFEEQAKKTPSSIAVASGDHRATYAELHERARGIGHALSSRGVRAGSLVVLLLGRGIDGVAAIAGTFAAGGAYLAFDPKEPDGRLSSVVAQAGPACLVTRRDAVDRARRIAGAIPVVAIEDLERGGAPADWASEAPHPESPAYVIFTSGSTGTPKGAVVTMQGMLNNQLSKVPYFGFTERDVIGQTASQSFDISVWQTLTGLLCGARVEIVADAIAHDASQLLAHVEKTGITVLESVPSLIRMMLEVELAPASLRWMIPTGEALPPELARRWFDEFPRVPLVNAYGPAECADDVSLYRIDAAPPADQVHVPIGTPTDNSRLFVFDRQFERVGVGVVGEIGVAGLGLGHGYLGDPARTAEVFVPNPFAETPGERLYRTGDRGFLGQDGTFTYVGRADHQVKVRGHRIELGEIESRLGESPEIAACVVVVREIGAGDKRIVAYVVPNASAPRDLLGHVRAWLRARLPEYMVPAHVVRLEALPLSQNGKVDRKRLPGIDAAETRTEIEPLETPTEEKLAAIWKSVLKIATVSRRDSFFDLGGHSLLVTQVASRIAKELGAELTLRAVFETPVLANLAAEIDRASARGPVGLPLVPATRPARIPLSFGQRRIWFMWQMDPNGSLYNLSEAARWRGPLDHEALRTSFEQIIARHEALRTTFEEHDGDVFQVIGSIGPTAMPIEDARSVAPGTRDALVKRLAEEEAGLPFDLRQGPLLRLRVVDFADDDHVILVTAHHVAADGWSMHLIVDELAEIYSALGTTRTPQLPELPIQYADFSIWQRAWLAGEELERQLAYWKAQLGTEHPVLALPADHPRPASQSYRGQTHRFTIEPALANALRAIAREHDTTLFTVSLAAFMTMLARYSGDSDVRVGVPVATRQRHEIQSLVGFFVNTHVFRLDVRERETFGALVARLKDVALGAQAHQELPFERLVETLNPERSLGHSPLFQVLYNHVRPDHRALAELEGVSIAWTERRVYTTEFDMTVDAIEDVASGAVNVSVMYSTDLFERPTIERFAGHWQRLLASLGAAEGTRELRAHTFLAPGEHLGVAPHVTNHAADGLLIHERIAETAKRRGDAIALQSGDTKVSYRVLATRAFALARVLRSEGILEETRVGVLMDRSPDAIVAFLAVLAAGAAFVPIAPGLPAERLALLVAESSAPVIVTRRKLLDAANVPAGSRALYIEDVDFAHAPALALPRLTRDHAAYVVFTSGSTGTPKGVVVSHGAFAMHTEAAQQAYGIDERDTVLHSATFTFDAAIEQWAVPLGAGATVVLRGEELWTGEEILSSIETGGVSVVDLSPGVAAELARAAAEKRRLLPQLTCIVGGEALLRASCEQILETITPRRLVNAYGPTEAAMTPLAWITEGRGVPDTVHAPIGKPLGARTTYILDAHLAIAAPGVYGELYIGGEGIARGYLGRADLTADRFIPDPFGPPGSRLYRTGDRARVLPDGAVEFAGRSDRQLKLRGFRIEPGEVETALLASPRVREAFVHLQTTDGRDPRLVAYVAVDTPAGEDSELRAHLRARLPEFMVPSVIVAVAALPRTPNGKIDVRALPTVERREQEYAAPAEPIAVTLASIWQSVLGVERVGVDDNFFELGGDSIIALQAVSRARAAGIAMGPRDIFQHQTVGALATVARWATEREIDRAPVTGDAPLLPIQRWFFEQELAEPAHYNQSIVLSVPRDLDSDALARAVRAIVCHHDALRLSFVREQGGWRQTYRDELPEGLVRVVELDGEDPEAAGLRVGDELQRSLQLAAGQVIRFAHLRSPHGRGRLVVVAHHLVIDGVSWRILLEDLRSAYLQSARGDEPVLPPKTASLKRWADAVHTAIGVHAGERAYWESTVAGAAKDDRQRGTVATSRVYEIALSTADTSALLGEANRAYRTQVQDLLLAGLVRAWSRARGQSELLVELEGHGRDPIGDVDASRTIGWFTVQYPVLLTASEGDSGRVVSRVKAELRQVPSAGIGYGVLRYLTEEGRALHAGRAPDLTFNYLGQTDASDAGDDLFSIASFAAGDDIAPDAKLSGDLEINAFVRDGKLSIGFRYAAGISAASDVERLADAYADELAKLVVHCTSDGAGALVATDFAHANIDQGDLDDLVEEMS